jgi:hypothetical protein
MINLQPKKMTENLTRMAADSILAGGTSFTTGAIINPGPPSELTTVWIPIITGILAPLVKEIILSLREARRRRSERKAAEAENKEK